MLLKILGHLMAGPVRFGRQPYHGYGVTIQQDVLHFGITHPITPFLGLSITKPANARYRLIMDYRFFGTQVYNTYQAKEVISLGKKSPIPFQQRKRERAGKKASKQPPKKPRSSYPMSAKSGQPDDVRLYWSHFIQNPFAGPGRFFWTERMLWGNALIAALLTTLGATLEVGFHFLAMITVFINAFFLFFLFYYLFPWVADWIFRQLKITSTTVDGMKGEVIVISGWLVALSLTRLIPFYAPLAYWVASVLFAVLLLVALHRRIRTTWFQAALATAGGSLAVAIAMMILSRF